jgi:hypothetical protein
MIEEDDKESKAEEEIEIVSTSKGLEAIEVVKLWKLQ